MAQKGGGSLVETDRKALAGDPHSQLQLRPGHGGWINPQLCSVLILPTPQGPVFGRNLDWHPKNELARASCRLEYSRGGRKLFETAGWPGAIGAVTGLSHHGFGLALNYPCGSGCAFNPKGWPVLLQIRSLLEEAGSYAEALQRLRRQKITCPGLFTLAGGSNTEMAAVEHQGDDSRVHRPKVPRGVRVPRIVATNHFGGEEGSCVRYQRLAEEAFRHLEQESAVADEEIFQVLESVMLPDMTANHVVMRPRDRRLELRVPVDVTGRR